MTKALTLSALGLFAGVALATAAQAQAPAAPAAPAAAAPAAASPYNDDQLKRFGTALGALTKVNAEYAPKIAAATGDAKTTVQNEMATKMHETLTASGVSPAEYSEIAAAVQKDPALKLRVGQAMADAQPEAAATPPAAQ